MLLFSVVLKIRFVAIFYSDVDFPIIKFVVGVCYI